MQKTIIFFAVLIVSVLTVIAQKQERELGFERFQLREHEQAIEHFKKALETEPLDKDSMLYLGYSLVLTGENKAAKEHLAKWFKMKSSKNPLPRLHDGECKLDNSAGEKLPGMIRTKTIRFFLEIGPANQIVSSFQFDELPKGYNFFNVFAQTAKVYGATKDGKRVFCVAISPKLAFPSARN